MKYTEEERRQKRTERLALLDRAVEELTSSDAWAAWLKVRRHFHAYSWRNQLMIALQRPDTIAVKGFRQWEQLNRKVKKGSKAVWILAPAPFKTGEQTEAGEDIRKMYFKPVCVFAYEDTEQMEDKPEIQILPPLTDVEGDTLDAALARLDKWLVGQGVEVEYAEIKGAAKGWYQPGIHPKICIDLMPLNAQFKTLVHEAAHHLVRQDEPSQGSWTYDYEEVVVESTAYAVCATFGLETAGYSAGYVASWQEGQKPSDMVELVDRLATKIEEAARGGGTTEGRTGDAGRARHNEGEVALDDRGTRDTLSKPEPRDRGALRS